MRAHANLIGLFFLATNLSACVGPDSELSAIPAPTGYAASSIYTGQPLHSGQAGQDAKPPSGFVAFCERNPDECRVPVAAPREVKFSEENRAMLDNVNASVNRTIRPLDDQVHYGVAEYWTVPIDGYGDCEDYVLAKRKMLLLLGMPAPALRISVVLTPRLVRHAVLTVVTDQGDYVLDNMRDEVLPTVKTAYSWVERQDPVSRTGWVALN